MLNSSLHFQGIPVSGGIAIGKVYLFERRVAHVELCPLTEDQVEGEVARFRRALEMTAEEIRTLRQRVAESIDERQAGIFDAHLAILSDPILVDQTIRVVRENHVNPEYAFQQTVDGIAAQLAKIHDELYSERNSDFLEVARRLLNNLLCLDGVHLEEVHEDVIVVAHDLGPGDTAQMLRSRILGFCTNLGSQTSHTAIMAKALQIPAVLGLENITEHIYSGDWLIVDGNDGVVIVRPNTNELEAYRKIAIEWRSHEEQLARLRDLPAITLDGQRIAMLANIELPEEIDHVVEHGGEGVGLFRTEFTYLDRGRSPTEEEQYEIYHRVVKSMGTRMVVFRTLDLGGDKFLSAAPIDELNPFLGLRALRLCLENPEMFSVQLRALLRAAAENVLHILFPMVTGLEDIRRVKLFISEVRQSLLDRGMAVPREIKYGAMIEIPSAALTSDLLAREVDFFSIGTNDLIQYTLAVDRVNKRVAYLYEPLHPAVLRLIDVVVRNANEHNVPVAVCGEMAAKPEMAALLVGLGVRELSMGPISIPAVKQMLRSVRMSDLEGLARELLSFSAAEQIRERLHQRMMELVATSKATINEGGS